MIRRRSSRGQEALYNLGVPFPDCKESEPPEATHTQSMPNRDMILGVSAAYYVTVRKV